MNNDQEPKKGLCGTGFFTNPKSLEHSAKYDRSHLAIYGGTLAHFKTFRDKRKLRTSHEVSVPREAEVKFDYFNCTPNTGVMQSIRLKIKSI